MRFKAIFFIALSMRCSPKFNIYSVALTKAFPRPLRIINNEVRYLAGEKMGETTSKSRLSSSLTINSLTSSCKTYFRSPISPLIGMFVCLKESPLAQSKNVYNQFLEMKTILNARGGLERGARCKKYIISLGRRKVANFLKSSHVLAQKMFIKVSIIAHFPVDL
jgi:hypothetical protein